MRQNYITFLLILMGGLSLACYAQEQEGNDTLLLGNQPVVEEIKEPPLEEELSVTDSTDVKINRLAELIAEDPSLLEDSTFLEQVPEILVFDTTAIQKLLDHNKVKNVFDNRIGEVPDKGVITNKLKQKVSKEKINALVNNPSRLKKYSDKEYVENTLKNPENYGLNINDIPEFPSEGVQADQILSVNKKIPINIDGIEPLSLSAEQSKQALEKLGYKDVSVDNPEQLKKMLEQHFNKNNISASQVPLNKAQLIEQIKGDEQYSQAIKKLKDKTEGVQKADSVARALTGNKVGIPDIKNTEDIKNLGNVKNSLTEGNIKEVGGNFMANKVGSTLPDGMLEEKDKLLPKLDELTDGKILQQEGQEFFNGLESDHLKVVEKYLDDNEKVKEFTVKNKGAILPDKSFFEGNIGITRTDFLTFHISPQFGLKLNKNLSGGLGLTFQHTADKNAEASTVLGYKALGKYSVKQDKFYLQIENVSLFPNISYLNAEESIKKYENTTLLGGGYLLKIKKSLFLNLTLLYNFNEAIPAPALNKPWIIRVGFKI